MPLAITPTFSPWTHTSDDSYIYLSAVARFSDSYCIFFVLLFSLPPSCNSDPGSHSRLFPPPTHYGSCLSFLSRVDFSSFFPRRLASNCAYPRQALSAVDPFFIFASKYNFKNYGGIRTHGATLECHSSATTSPPGRVYLLCENSSMYSSAILVLVPRTIVHY